LNLIILRFTKLKTFHNSKYLQIYIIFVETKYLLNMKNKCILLLLLFYSSQVLSEEIYVNDIFIQRYNVFEENDKDWFFAAPLLNFFHSKTKEYVIRDELLFKKGFTTTDEYLYETERNLRATGLFTSVVIELDSIGFGNYNVYVTTKDRWSLYPVPVGKTGGGFSQYGITINENNLFGTGTNITAELINRKENNIGLQYRFELFKRRSFRTDFSLYTQFLTNNIRDELHFSLAKNFLTLDDKFSYGITALKSKGKEFIYIKDNYQLTKIDENKVDIWFSRAWQRKDRVFFTALAEYHRSDREKPEYERAFDNCGKILFGFSSISENYYTVNKINSYFYEDLIVGGWGSAVLGKIYPIGNRGKSYYYVAGEGEKSYFVDNFYIFARLVGASAFKRASGFFTYQEFYANAFYKLFNNLLITTRLQQQTVWNWSKLRQLIIDNDIGLRGYKLNQNTGDNRIIFNTELRYFPDLPLWLFNFSFVTFTDLGSVWQQDVKLSKSQFLFSSGLGIRLHFNKSDNPKHILRIDFAYNHKENKFGGIIIAFEQFFSAFRNHKFSLPQLHGLEFDGD